MLATMIPLFDEKVSVKAYSLFSQKKNLFTNPSLQGTGSNDGAGLVTGLDIIDSLGIENLANNSDIFVPVTNISLFSDIEAQCDVPHEKLILLIDKTVEPTESNIERIKYLKSKGYQFAIRKLSISDFEPYRALISLMDYIFLNHRKIMIGNARIYFTKLYPNIKLVACGVDTMDDFNKLIKTGGYSFYEGNFYRMPITKGLSKVSPVKVNYIELLNIVNDSDFDLTDAADVIGKDTALVLLLLELVNKISINSEITSVRHAAAMLGQHELKKWITTAVTKQLCEDKPGEITRISLLRAKFAENLAPIFDEASQSQELFMMGLFSIIDIILDKPMKEALEMLHVSKNISSALTEQTGSFAPIYDFIRAYEIADWAQIDRTIIMNKLDADAIYNAYIDSMKWYKTLFSNN